MDNNQKLNELFASEEFKAEAAQISTAEELQALFARHDVEMTVDEVIELCGKIAKHAQGGEEELNEEALEDVAGGIAWLAIGVAVLCIGALAIGIYNGYRSCQK